MRMKVEASIISMGGDMNLTRNYHRVEPAALEEIAKRLHKLCLPILTFT